MTKKSGIGIIRRIVNHNLKISKQATIWWIKFIEKFRTLELDEAAGSIDILLANQTECEYNSTFPPPPSSAIKKVASQQSIYHMLANAAVNHFTLDFKTY